MLNSFAKFTFITLHGFGIINSNHLIRFPKEHKKLICDNITYIAWWSYRLYQFIFFIYHVSQFARFIWYIIQRKKTPTWFSLMTFERWHTLHNTYCVDKYQKKSSEHLTNWWGAFKNMIVELCRPKSAARWALLVVLIVCSNTVVEFESLNQIDKKICGIPWHQKPRVIWLLDMIFSLTLVLTGMYLVKTETSEILTLFFFPWKMSLKTLQFLQKLPKQCVGIW